MRDRYVGVTLQPNLTLTVPTPLQGGDRSGKLRHDRRCKISLFMLTAGLATPWTNAYFWGGWGGMGCDNICSHEHMFDATQQLGLGWDGK